MSNEFKRKELMKKIKINRDKIHMWLVSNQSMKRRYFNIKMLATENEEILETIERLKSK